MLCQQAVRMPVEWFGLSARRNPPGGQRVQAKMVDDDGDGDYWRTDMRCQHDDAQDDHGEVPTRKLT